MITTVFVVYADNGAYEGCTTPKGVFSTKEAAALALFETTAFWKTNGKIAEIVLDAQIKENEP